MYETDSKIGRVEFSNNLIFKNKSMQEEINDDHYKNITLPPMNKLGSNISDFGDSFSVHQLSNRNMGTSKKRPSFSSNLESIKVKNLGTRNKHREYSRVSKNKNRPKFQSSSVQVNFSMGPYENSTPFTITNKKNIMPQELHSIINDPKGSLTIPAPLK